MMAKEALDAAVRVDRNEPGHRLRRFETICRPRGHCQHEPLSESAGQRWTWCPDCLTVYDDSGKAMNQIEELR